MTRIYINKREKESKIDWLEFLLEVLVGAITLMLASYLFENFYIQNLWYAIIASIIIGGLNVSLKPLLIVLTLPVTVASLGLFYPFINVIILKITSLLLGDAFIVKGWIIPFFVAIFIAIMSKILKALIVNPYKERRI